MTFGTATELGLTSVRGRKLSVATNANLTGMDKRITHPCVDATITIGAEAANARAITIQLLDAYGNDIAEVTPFEIHMLSTAAGIAYATGGSTGVAIGTDGALLAVVAKRIFACTSEADGDWDGTYTDTGTESLALAVKLPNGNMIITDAFANT
jgi:hypothetical protein